MTLKTPDGEETIEVDGDTYILDAAEVCATGIEHMICWIGSMRLMRCPAQLDPNTPCAPHLGP